VGRFESAHGGTLFLDEIGDISLETQIKLLRVLQTRQFEPVGSTRTLRVDVRLIAATNQDLKKLISEGRFREDLFYRLNVISIALPTLAERKEDIHELSLHFLKRTSQRLGKPIAEIDDDALNALKRHSWPGNIRELENVIERAVVLAERDRVALHDLPQEVIEGRSMPAKPLSSRSSSEAKPRGGSGIERVAEAVAVGIGSFGRKTFGEVGERQAIEDALRATDGNKAEAARLLGIPRSTLFSKLRKYRINKPR
jgi:DNA-binding NtrC family response regulator